jgi:hypothetical protein
VVFDIAALVHWSPVIVAVENAELAVSAADADTGRIFHRQMTFAEAY